MEVWKDIKGYEGLYIISNTGKVKGLKRNKLLKLVFIRQINSTTFHRQPR